MSVAERDFSSFYLGDNVYELARGLVPEIADKLEVPIAGTPTSEDLQSIMQKVGTNKVLRQNQEIEAIDRDEMVDLVERSGVQNELQRSLWTPDISVICSEIEATLIMGGVANWQDRSADAIGNDLKGVPIYSIAGSRLMDGTTEITNPNVISFHGKFGRYPTEAEYAGSVVVPYLVEDGYAVLHKQKETTNGDEMLYDLMSEEPRLLESRIAVARVANAGVIVALQVRAVARTLNANFDADPKNPQLFVITDTFPLATNASQENDPANYQKAGSALRQVVLTAKKLHEAS